MKAKRKEAQVMGVKFYSLLSGGIGLFHRPSQKSLEYLRTNTSCSVVFTLQTPTECPFEVRDYCKALGLQWYWIDLPGSNKKLVQSNETLQKLRQGLLDAREMLSHGDFLLIHCAAGIHRTGVFAYALLRICGFDAERTFETIQILRIQTYNGCGMVRFKVAERVAMEILRGEADAGVAGLQLRRDGQQLSSGFFWLDLRLTYQMNIEFRCYASDLSLTEYIPGPAGQINTPKGKIQQDLGHEWIEAMPVVQAQELREHSVSSAMNELMIFCRRNFSNSPVLCCKQQVLVLSVLETWMPSLASLFNGAHVDLGSVSILTSVEFPESIVESMQQLKELKQAFTP